MADGRYTLVLKLDAAERQELEEIAAIHGLKLWEWAILELRIAQKAALFRYLGTPGFFAFAGGPSVEAEPQHAQLRQQPRRAHVEHRDAEDSAAEAADVDVDAIVAGRLAAAEQAGLTAPRPPQEPPEEEVFYEEGGVRPLQSVAGQPFRGSNRSVNISRSSLRGGR